MNIDIRNNVKDLSVTVNKNSDGSFAILLVEKNGKKLGSCDPGSVVKLGEREYVVLGHGSETTAVITKDFAKEMTFGDSGNYATSDVRKFCNGEFLNELAAAVGLDNIITHTVSLVANDGTGKGKTCKDKVSILTVENYRRYREFLPGYGDWWWTATRFSNDGICYSYRVCCVGSRGVLDWGGCCVCRGVRPFCILNSSILVS